MGEKSLNELLDSKNLKYSEIDINDYIIIKTLGNSNSSYLIRKKETPDFYVMKLFDMKSDKALEYAERAEEVTLNYHQTFVRFCGFSRQISINGVNQIAFLSEYIPNGSRRNYFDDIHKNDENSKKLKAKEPIIMYGIAMGLYQLHYHLILHKVIKPEHIYLDSYYHPYINVFKLQKNKTLMDYQQSISNQEDFSYLPPEFFDDDSHIIDNENITLFDINASISSDVYSYCLMLFEAFTSQFPSISNKDKKNLDEIKDIIKSEFLTSEQIEILTQLLNKNPTYRPGLDYVLKLMEKFYDHDNYYGADFAEYLNSLRLDRKVAIYSKQIISQLDNVNPMGAEMMEIQKYRDKTEFEELMNNYKNLQSDDLDFRANRKLLLKRIKSIGLQYLAQNDYKSAELYYENVIKSIDADNNHFMFHLGHILLHSYDEEQQKKGIQFLEKSAKNNYRKSIEDLSYYYFMKKEYSKSIEYIEQGKSLEKQSQKCLYLFQLGRYLKIQGFGEHTDVDDAIISNLEIPDGEALLGKILFHLNDPEHSKQHLINAIKNKSSIAFGFFGDVLADSDEDHTNKSKMNYRSFPYYQQSSIFNEIDGSLQLGKYYKSEYETHSNFILKEFSLYYLKKAKKMGSFEAQCLMEEVVDSLDSEMLIPYQANLCNYDVIRKIGKGNQGKVYLVQDKKTKSYCILKIIKNFDEKLFVREVNISFKINHPNVLHFIGFTKPVFKNNKLLLAPTILCEYIPNGNLGDLLKDIKNNKRKIDDTDKFIIAYGIASGMKELHSHSIIHRDLKPDNVLLDDNNQTYIADFGLSKKFRDTTTHVHIPYTDGKSLTGTARYASINSLKGIEQSRRDDMESLAYVWIYLLKGCLPWMGLDGKDRKQKYDRICAVKQKTSLETLCEGLPDEFITYLSSVKALRFAETPNYLGYKKMFRKLFLRLGYEYDYKYDWLTPHKPPRPISKTPQTLEQKVKKADNDDEDFLKARQKLKRERSRDALPRPKLQKNTSVPQVRLTHIISSSSSDDDYVIDTKPKPKKKTPMQTIQFQPQRLSPRRTQTSTRRLSAVLTSSPNSSSRAAALPKWMMERPTSSYRPKK